MAILAPPQVSIIVPCYNQERFLTDALESILRQDFIDWECIMVNDGSTDHTETIAIDYCSRDVRFKYIKTANGGLSFARNTGISGAKGDFIQLLDADDLLEQQKLTYALAFYHANEMAPTVIPYSSMRYFEHDAPADLKILGRDDFVAHVEMHGEDSLESQKMVVKARNPFVISAPLYPRTLFLSIGDFDENLTALEDWDFHLRCVSAGYRFHHQYK
jgi:glycosyltransferase involved in cell wall biosynthesis